ncbi:MAG TPA: hypothetical protein VGO52_23540 [Hyphomonadaceae bacterium]|jgi:hypothetical protein|nr:hypothetical protein [Hyphomonadaceae bacterium]
MSDDPDYPNEAARLASLWEECIAGWYNLIRAFGHPIDLMRWGWMRALEHRALGRWLRDLEDLVRRAIRNEALTRDVPAPKLRRRRADRRRTRPASPGDMPRFRPTCRTDPLTWKVSFRMSKPGQGGQRRTPRTTREPAARRLCRGFAYRIEALRRAIRYRDDYVMRHARRMARLAEAGRASDPIMLPLPIPREDPPDRQPILLSAAIPRAPPASSAPAHEAAPWIARHIEPG